MCAFCGDKCLHQTAIDSLFKKLARRSFVFSNKGLKIHDGRVIRNWVI